MENKRFLAVYQRPLIRDWAFWWSIFWAFFTVYAVRFPAAGQAAPTAPAILEVPLSFIFGFFLFGWSIAGVRTLIRAFIRGVRRQGRPTPTGSRPPIDPPRPEPSNRDQWPIYPRK